METQDKFKPVVIFFSGHLEIDPKDLKMKSLKEEDSDGPEVIKSYSEIPQEELDEGLWIMYNFSDAYRDATDGAFEELNIEANLC